MTQSLCVFPCETSGPQGGATTTSKAPTARAARSVHTPSDLSTGTELMHTSTPLLSVVPPAEDVPLERLRIVVAEGAILVRRHLLIELAGIETTQIVGVVGNVARAIEVVRKTRPDLLLLDFLLPGGGALHVLDSIEADAAKNVIVTTPFPYDEYRGACESRGVTRVLASYPSAEELRDTLASVRQRSDS